jgi:hypothetical protein
MTTSPTDREASDARLQELEERVDWLTDEVGNLHHALVAGLAGLLYADADAVDRHTESCRWCATWDEFNRAPS